MQTKIVRFPSIIKRSLSASIIESKYGQLWKKSGSFCASLPSSRFRQLKENMCIAWDTWGIVKLEKPSSRFMNEASELVTFRLQCLSFHWIWMNTQTHWKASQRSTVSSFIHFHISVYDLISSWQHATFFPLPIESQEIFSHFSRTVKWSSRKKEISTVTINCNYSSVEVNDKIVN